MTKQWPARPNGASANSQVTAALFDALDGGIQQNGNEDSNVGDSQWTPPWL